MSSDNSDRKRNIGEFLEILFFSSFTVNSGKFSKFGASKPILFQLKFFCKNIKGTTLQVISQK